MSGRHSRDTAQLKSAILAALPQLVRQWLPGGEQRGTVYVARNPHRNDRSLGSFKIDTLTGEWRDWVTSDGGKDAVSLYAYLFTHGDYHTALNTIAIDPLVRAARATGVTAPPANTAKPLRPSASKLALVRRLYNDAVAISGMPAEAYLRNRGLRPTDAWDGLRASVQPYQGRGRYPVLIAPIEALDGSMVGLHRSYLTPLGTKLDVPVPRLTLGQVRGGAIRLGAQPSDELIVCEGLEDGLTLYQELAKPVPVWVAGGASFLHSMAIPDSVRRLTIAADNDAAGERAARRAADVFGVGGREVRIMRPKPGVKDFNEQIQGNKS